MKLLLSLSSLGVRPGRKGREAWADYPKPLGGLYDGFWSEFVGVKILYGSPKVLKMRETSAGMKTRRVCNVMRVLVRTASLRMVSLTTAVPRTQATAVPTPAATTAVTTAVRVTLLVRTKPMGDV